MGDLCLQGILSNLLQILSGWRQWSSLLVDAVLNFLLAIGELILVGLDGDN